MATSPEVGRCVECHSDISVLPTYTHGDHIRCGSCGTAHKVLRSPVLKLVLADVSRLQESLGEIEMRIGRRQDELRGARGRLGIGVHGLYLGLAYVLFQIGLRDRPIEASLMVESIALALVAAATLEILNYQFFAKRQRIERIEAEIDTLRREALDVRRRIRESQRA